jgi:Ca2+-binding RTX toxin-like protein
VASPFSNSVPVTSINTMLVGLGRYTIDGTKWGGGLGTGVTLTYSFPGAGAAHASPYGYYTTNDEWQGFSPLTTGEKAAARAGLAVWSAVANINFVETAETTTTVGEIRFGKSSSIDPNEYAHAYLPANDPSAGDVWFHSTNWNATHAASIAAGTDDFHTIIHELGHALGLKHSFDAPDAIPNALDNYFYSVMSYSARTHLDSGSASFYPTTPMYYDLLGIQALYGRNLSHNAGNTVYTFVEGKQYFQTIDDASGTDTIVYSGNQATSIDLAQGHFSTLSAPILFDNGSTRATVAIGPNTLIENATGGNGADQICGNGLANTLSGGAGNDHLYGYAGNDKLFGGTGNDVLVGGAGNDAFYFNLAPSATTNKDSLADFNSVDDTIYLSHAVFTQLAVGTVNIANFWTGTAAHDANDFIVYDKIHGTLSYDSNGNAAGGSAAFATVTAYTVVTTADIVIY